MNQLFSVGDYIVDSTYIYRVTAVKLVKDAKGSEETYMYYQPTVGTDKKFTASIPVANLNKAGTRKILTKKECQEIIEGLKKHTIENEYNILTAKEMIYQNSPRGIVSVLSYYWTNTDVLGKMDRELMDQVLDHLCQEISLVTKKKFGDVKKNMVSILNKRN